MSGAPLSAGDLARVAARFKLLGEPARLRVLQCLQRGPQHVTALMDATALRQANLSKHLQTLHTHGLVARTRVGRFIHYAIADPTVLALCDLMCRQLAHVAPPRRRPSERRPSTRGVQARATPAGPGRHDH